MANSITRGRVRTAAAAAAAAESCNLASGAMCLKNDSREKFIIILVSLLKSIVWSMLNRKNVVTNFLKVGDVIFCVTLISHISTLDNGTRMVIAVFNTSSRLMLTRTTTWNLPGPNETRDCINIVNLSHPSSVEANTDVIHNQRQKTIEVASVSLFRHILNTKSWRECCFSLFN